MFVRAKPTIAVLATLLSTIVVAATPGCDDDANITVSGGASASARPPGHAAGTAVAGLPAPAKGSATLDGLFMVVRFSGSSITQFYYFFTPAGYVFTDVPTGGPEQFDFAAAAKDKPDVTGTYVVNGGKLTMTFANGKSEELDYEINEQGHVELGGLYAHKAEPFKPGTTFDGSYSGGATARGAGTFVSSASTYTFKPDGTYTRSGVGGVSFTNSDGTSGGGKSESSDSGSYAVSGNTLELKHADGSVTRHTIFPYEDYNKKIQLNIDGAMYKPE